jgi:hypothetical protein
LVATLTLRADWAESPISVDVGVIGWGGGGAWGMRADNIVVAPL